MPGNAGFFIGSLRFSARANLPKDGAASLIGRARAAVFLLSPPALRDAPDRGRTENGTRGGQVGDAARRFTGDRSALRQTENDRFDTQRTDQSESVEGSSQ